MLPFFLRRLRGFTLRRTSRCRPVVPVLQHRWNHPTSFVRSVRILKPTDKLSINVGICAGAAEDMAHSSLRFGIGRFTTEAEIDFVVGRIVHVVNRLRDMRSAVLGCLSWRLLTCILVRCGKWCKRESTSNPLTGHSIDITYLCSSRDCSESYFVTLLVQLVRTVLHRTYDGNATILCHSKYRQCTGLWSPCARTFKFNEFELRQISTRLFQLLPPWLDASILVVSLLKVTSAMRYIQGFVQQDSLPMLVQMTWQNSSTAMAALWIAES